MSRKKAPLPQLTINCNEEYSCDPAPNKLGKQQLYQPMFLKEQCKPTKVCHREFCH